MSRDFMEMLESRTLLSAAAVSHPAPPVMQVDARHAKRKHHAAPVAPASAIPASGNFSYTVDGYTFSGSVNGTTHALTATITGPMLDLALNGTYDPTAQTLTATITGSNTDLTVSGSLVGNTVTGSVNGTFFGFSVSINNGSFTF